MAKKKVKKENNSKWRETTAGTQVILNTKLGCTLWLCDAVTKGGVFQCVVAEEDLI